MLKYIVAFAILAFSSEGAIAQLPSWEDLALEEQKNAARDQLAADAIISVLQAEIASLKAELTKQKAPPQNEPTK